MYMYMYTSTGNYIIYKYTSIITIHIYNLGTNIFSVRYYDCINQYMDI